MTSFLNLKLAGVLGLALSVGLTSGCAQNLTRTSRSQPLNSLIEPAKDSRQVDSKATLAFPASIAVIYVPSSDYNIPRTAIMSSADALRQQLLADQKYIRSVTVVSLDDVASKVSLANIRALYDADMTLIVTYEQDQSSQQSGPGGLIDGTIVGAFVVPSVKTTTTTRVEAKVVHIPSNALVFRHSAGDSRTSHSTSYGQKSTMHNESADSLLKATTALGDTLLSTLQKFDNFDLSHAVSMDVLTANEVVDIPGHTTSDGNWNRVDRFKLTGGGSIDGIALVAGLAMLVIVRRRRHAESAKNALSTSPRLI